MSHVVYMSDFPISFVMYIMFINEKASSSAMEVKGDFQMCCSTLQTIVLIMQHHLCSRVLHLHWGGQRSRPGNCYKTVLQLFVLWLQEADNLEACIKRCLLFFFDVYWTWHNDQWEVASFQTQSNHSSHSDLQYKTHHLQNIKPPDWHFWVLRVQCVPAGMSHFPASHVINLHPARTCSQVRNSGTWSESRPHRLTLTYILKIFMSASAFVSRSGSIASMKMHAVILDPIWR